MRTSFTEVKLGPVYLECGADGEVREYAVRDVRSELHDLEVCLYGKIAYA